MKDRTFRFSILPAVFLGAGLVLLPFAQAHAAAPMPGSVPGINGLVFNIIEPPEQNETNNEPPISLVISNLPPGTFFNSGSLLMSEPGTVADPNDTNHVNWSDVVQWAGGNQVVFFSDPTAFPDLRLPFGVGTVTAAEVLNPGGGDGLVYKADDGNGNITTWNIISDVPEPATLTLLGLGLAVLGRRLLRRQSA